MIDRKSLKEDFWINFSDIQAEPVKETKFDCKDCAAPYMSEYDCDFPEADCSSANNDNCETCADYTCGPVDCLKAIADELGISDLVEINPVNSAEPSNEMDEDLIATEAPDEWELCDYHCLDNKTDEDTDVVVQGIKDNTKLNGADCAVKVNNKQPLIAYDADSNKEVKKLTEGFTKADFDEYVKLCDEIGLKTNADVKMFMQNECGKDFMDPEDLLVALRNYREELGDDFNLPPEERGLYKKVESVDSNTYKGSPDINPDDFASDYIDYLADKYAAEDEVNLAAEYEDDISDEEFVEAFGKEIASKHNPENLEEGIFNGIPTARLEKLFTDFKVRCWEDVADQNKVTEKTYESVDEAVKNAQLFSKRFKSGAASVVGIINAKDDEKLKNAKEYGLDTENGEALALYKQGEMTSTSKTWISDLLKNVKDDKKEIKQVNKLDKKLDKSDAKSEEGKAAIKKASDDAKAAVTGKSNDAEEADSENEKVSENPLAIKNYKLVNDAGVEIASADIKDELVKIRDATNKVNNNQALKIVDKDGKEIK